MPLNDDLSDESSALATWLIVFLVILISIVAIYLLSSCSTKVNSTIGQEKIEAGFNIGISKNVD